MTEFEYAYFRSEAELRAGVLIWQIVSPILIIFGTVGNVLSIVILSRRSFNRWASTVYLLGLSVSGLGVLYVGLLRQWIIYMFDSDIRTLHPVLCKVHWWLMYTCADIPIWILTAITIERLIATLLPYKSKKICTKSRATIVIVMIVVGTMAINSHLLFGFGKLEVNVKNETIVKPCVPLTDEYRDFFEKVWTWIDLCKFSLIPFAVLTTGNTCIIYRIVSSHRKVRKSSSSSNQSSTSKRKISNMTTLLISLNFVFIISTLPVCIYFIGQPYWIPKDIPDSIRLQDPWWALVNMGLYIHNTTNFILYCLTGSRFRKAFKKMIFCFSKLNRDSITHVNATNSLSTAI